MDVQNDKSGKRCFPWEQDRALRVKGEISIGEATVTSQDVETIEAKVKLASQGMCLLQLQGGDDISILILLQCADPPQS